MNNEFKDLENIIGVNSDTTKIEVVDLQSLIDNLNPKNLSQPETSDDHYQKLDEQGQLALATKVYDSLNETGVSQLKKLVSGLLNQESDILTDKTYPTDRTQIIDGLNGLLKKRNHERNNQQKDRVESNPLYTNQASKDTRLIVVDE